MRALSRKVRRMHNFDVRATDILTDVLRFLDGASAEKGRGKPVLRSERDRRPRVHLVDRREAISSAASFVRLICPLTHEYADIDFSIGDADDLSTLPAADMFVARWDAVRSKRQVFNLRRHLRTKNAALIVDVAGLRTAGFDATGVEAELIRLADYLWLEEGGPKSWVSHQNPEIPDTIDRRIWNVPGGVIPTPGGRQKLRFVYFAERVSADAHADLAVLLPVFSKLSRGGLPVDLTVIGHAGLDTEVSSGVHYLPPPGVDMPYPRFIRWLLHQGPFDVGIASTGPRAGVQQDSAGLTRRLLEFGALGLLPLAGVTPPLARRKSTVICAESQPGLSGWMKTIARLAKDRTMVRSIAMSARDFVAQERDVLAAVRVQAMTIDAAWSGRGRADSRRQLT